MKKAWLAACLLASVFAVACNGEAGDAIRSIASGLPSRSGSVSLPSPPDISLSPSISVPTDVAPSPSEEPEPSASEEPEPTPSEAPEPTPSEEPEPSEEPTPSEEPEPSPSEEPSPTPTEEPTPSEEPSPSEEPEPGPSGEASSGVSGTVWWILGLLAVAGVIAALVMRSRRRPSATLQQAYAASAALRDRLGQEVSTPPATPATPPGAIEPLVDEADRTLRVVGIAAPDEATRAAVAQTLRAVGDVRSALALRATSTGAAHVSGTDIEAGLLRALAALDAALGPLRDVTLGVAPPPTTGFET